MTPKRELLLLGARITSESVVFLLAVRYFIREYRSVSKVRRLTVVDTAGAVHDSERQEYPALGGIVAGYFHQDYDLYGETFDEIVSVIKEDSTPRQIDEMSREIGRFLDRYGESEEMVEKAFRQVFTPETSFEGWNGRSTRDALLKIVEIMSDDAIPCKPEAQAEPLRPVEGLMSWFRKPSGFVPEYPERAPYPRLNNLVHGYFHQDYDILSEDPDEIMAIYKGREWPVVRDGLLADIRLFLATYGSSDAEVAESFRRIFKPDADFDGWNGRTTREALLKIVEILSDDVIPGKLGG